MMVIEKMGYFFGRLARSEDGLSGLKNGLEKFFDELKEFKDFEFSSEFVNGKLVTRSRCPIYKYLKIWCGCCCLNFIKGFARAYGVKEVRRISKQPEEKECVFEFK